MTYTNIYSFERRSNRQLSGETAEVLGVKDSDCFVSCGFLGHCYQTSLLMTLLPDNTRPAFES